MNARAIRILLFATATVATLAMGYSSQFPGPPGTDPRLAPPNDPDYEGLWHYFSDIPPNHRGTMTPEEAALGSGMHVDQAWQIHQGTPETLIALLDSGIQWETDDLRDRIFINAGELPLPERCTKYDCNGDGRVSVSDYEHDTRGGDRNHNGIVDAEDIILAFSDGIDQDGNGFVDDISGWDFHEHDNNPGDRVRFGHGTGEGIDSTAALNNGKNGAGACGNCTVMFLRVNDSFIVDANSFAAATYYAVDRGAVVIQEALGSINHNRMTQAAVNYAWEHNTVIIGSAADENSYHHNFPATLDPVIYVNALRFDTVKASEATSFLAFNNCSNLGARIDVAASGLSCSSEATGHLSGITALAASYAKSLGKPLKAGELVSLIKTSATDVNLGSNAQQPDRHSTWQGWDRVTGYGRTNAYEMLMRIKENKIPPVARIVSPKWFELTRRGSRRTIPIEIETGVPRSSKLRARLEVTRGVDTADSTWLTVKDSGNQTTSQDGIFTDVSIDVLDALAKNTIDGPEYANAITFRLIVDNLEGQSSEARRTIFLFDDQNLLPGFPKKIGGSGESAGLFVDLRSDGKEEYVTIDGGGMLHAFTSTGDELSGFPTRATGISAYNVPSMLGHSGAVYASPFGAVAAGDLDGDGHPEIVVTSMEGDISVICADGKMAAGSPFRLPFPDMNLASEQQVIAQGIYNTPVIADTDNDGINEIIIGGADGLLYEFDMRGHLKKGFPVAVTKDGIRAKIVSSPAIYDIDGDGIKDIIIGTNHSGRNAGYLFAINGTGSHHGTAIKSGFPIQIPLIRDALLPTIGTGVPTAPIVADFDHDGTKEILIHGFAGKGYIVGLNGQIKRSMSVVIPNGRNVTDTSMITGFGHPSIADVFGEGFASPVMLGVGSKMLVSMALGGKRLEVEHFLGVWDGKTGTLRDSFPRKISDLPLMPSPVSADITGDGKDEVIVGTGGYFVHAFSERGEAPGFPAFTGGWMISSPSVGDMNGDGFLEVAGTTREGYLFIWKTQGRASQKMTWPTFKGNNQRTGVQGDQL